ncbi:hypothetical protein CYMTET_36685, partial [Cymbomonas tetramitiformis]
MLCAVPQRLRLIGFVCLYLKLLSVSQAHAPNASSTNETRISRRKLQQTGSYPYQFYSLTSSSDGDTSCFVIATQDNTAIDISGSTLSLNSGAAHSFTCTDSVVVLADKPVNAYTNKREFCNRIHAGRNFVWYIVRSPQKRLLLQAVSTAATVTVYSKSIGGVRTTVQNALSVSTTSVTLVEASFSAFIEIVATEDVVVRVTTSWYGDSMCIDPARVARNDVACKITASDGVLLAGQQIADGGGGDGTLLAAFSLFSNVAALPRSRYLRLLGLEASTCSDSSGNSYSLTGGNGLFLSVTSSETPANNVVTCSSAVMVVGDEYASRKEFNAISSISP